MKKSKKPKKIRSIKHQITFTFIGLLFLSILTISMINGAFLEKYYVSKKTETLLEAREVLSQINTDSMTEDDVESEQEELSSEIIQESSRNNLTWVVVNEDNTKYLCWPENEDQLRSKLFFGYASDLDMDNGKGTILKQTDNCVVQQVYDRFPDEIPQTSLPDGGTIHNTLEKARADGYEKALVVCISSGLSGTYNMVRLVCQEYGGLETFVLDTRNISFLSLIHI